MNNMRRGEQAGLEDLFVLLILDCWLGFKPSIAICDLCRIEKEKRPANFSVDLHCVCKGFTQGEESHNADCIRNVLKDKSTREI
jgi:hypothetical protein